jgi:hypothetical protein
MAGNFPGHFLYAAEKVTGYPGIRMMDVISNRKDIP